VRDEKRLNEPQGRTKKGELWSDMVEDELGLNAPLGKSAPELLVERRVQPGERKDHPKTGLGSLGKGLSRATSPQEESPYLNTSKAAKGGPDLVMKAALQIPDPVIRAGMAGTLNTVRMCATPRGDDTDSSSEEEEEERAEQGRKEGKGPERPEKVAEAKEPEQKVKRSDEKREVQETQKRELEAPRLHHEMPDAPKPMEPEAETDRERLNILKTEEEGRRMVQESIEQVLKPQRQERLEEGDMNPHEGQEPGS
jgi:hypothetical protein